MLRLAIVGVGGYGAHHLKGFSILEGEGLVKVIALADPSARALEKARTTLPEARIYPDYQTLLDAEELDAVVLATPIPLHEEMTLEAVRRGLYVLLEKPAVPLFSQWKRLVREDLHGRVAVAFQRISAPGLQIVRRLIDEGSLGSLRSISVAAVWPRTTRYYQRAEWAGQLRWNSRPVLDGPATNGLAHYINDIMFLTGDQAGSFGVPDEIQGEVYRARQIPSYDTVCLQGTVAGDVRFVAGFSHAGSTISKSRLRIEGSKGVIWVEQEGAVQSDEIDIPEFFVSEGRDEMWRDFVDFAAGRTTRPRVLLKDVKGYTLATNLMFQSAGGIRTVPAPYSRPGFDHKGGEVTEIKHINRLLQRAAERLCSLSEAGASWAQGGEVVAAGNFSESKMLEAIMVEDAVGAVTACTTA